MRIKSIPLIGGEKVEFGDFNVIIGPNSTGKSTLLIELFLCSGSFDKNPWFWIKDKTMEWAIDDPIADIESFLGCLDKVYQNGTYSYVPRGLRAGDGRIDASNPLNHNHWKAMEELKVKAVAERDAVIFDLKSQVLMRRTFVTFEPCENRLNFPHGVALQALNSPAGDEINLLYRNKALLQNINDKFCSQFGLNIVILDHTRTSLEIGLTKDSLPNFDLGATDLQREYQRIEEWKQRHFHPVSTAGHGIRSIVKLLLSILMPHYQIIIIDEPEMHIYPAQKRWLGRQLADMAVQFKKQVFLATHDPIFLQGILDSNLTTTILRADGASGGKRFLHSCLLDNQTDVGARRNQDTYLQALFYLRTVVVEGATDRAFYQNMVESLFNTRIEASDLGFVSCGGKGGSNHMAHLASRIGLKVAFIFDFDVLLFDLSTLGNILTLKGATSSTLGKLAELYQNEFGSDAGRIRRGTDDAKGRGGRSNFVKSHSALFYEVMSQLKQNGIFIVPSGSLESWAPAVDPKVRFADLAPALVLGDKGLRKELEEFLSEVLVYLDCFQIQNPHPAGVVDVH